MLNKPAFMLHQFIPLRDRIVQTQNAKSKLTGLALSRVRNLGKIESQGNSLAAFDFQVIVREGIGFSILKKHSNKISAKKLIDYEQNKFVQAIAQNDEKTFEQVNDLEMVDRVLRDAEDPFVLALALHQLMMGERSVASMFRSDQELSKRC